MVYNLLNHIQGKNGSRWAKFVGETGMDNVLVLAIDAAKYMHKAMISTFYGDILVRPFEVDAVPKIWQQGVAPLFLYSNEKPYHWRLYIQHDVCTWHGS